MKKEWQDIIVSTLQKINPKLKMYIINSSIVSAQNRVRMYITDFDFKIPEDKGIKLKDIIECGCVDREKSYCLDANYWKGGNLRTYFEKSRRQLVFGDGCKQVGVADLNGHDILKRVYSVEGKSPTLNTCGGGNREPKIHCKDNTLQWRKLTVKECCRLQTLPDDYCKAVSNSQGYKILGNGWTNEVIKFILKGENK